jgi:hypothetical protein
MSAQAGPTFRRPKTILPVPTPSPKFQRVEDGVPDSQLTREATGLLREFSTTLRSWLLSKKWGFDLSKLSPRLCFCQRLLVREWGPV